MKFESTENLYDDTTGWIETANGEPFHPDRPTFNVEVIAHALAMNCRFNGHCSQFYSVAEHSILVAELMDYLGLGDPFEGLLHDASEAFLSDIPSPLKRKVPGLVTLDKEIDRACREFFDLPPTMTKECKLQDWCALFIEARWLLPSRGETFYDPYNLRPRAMEFFDRFRPICYDPVRAKAAWLSAYRTYAVTHPNVPKISPVTAKNGIVTAL